MDKVWRSAALVLALCNDHPADGHTAFLITLWGLVLAADVLAADVLAAIGTDKE